MRLVYRLRKSAFTLMELLIVIAIVALLSSYILAAVNSARVKARDVKRIASVREIEKALSLYYDSNRTYPPSLAPACDPTTNAFFGLEELMNFGVMNSVPKDPAGTGNAVCFKYATPTGAGTQLTYHLGISLEDITHKALSGDSNFNSSATGANYTNQGFDGSNAGKCDSNHFGLACYDVVP